MTSIFLDESGQLGKNSQQPYFVVGSFLTNNPRRTSKQFTAWQHTRFPRLFQDLPEIKFADNRIDHRLRLKTIQFLADLGIRIHYTYLSCSNIPDRFIKKGSLRSGHLYTEIIAETLESYVPINHSQFAAFCDQRHLKGIKQRDFESILESRIRLQLPTTIPVQINMLDSVQYSNIQIADWVTGVIAAYLNEKPLGDAYYALLKNNLLGDGKELFKDHWGEKFTNKKLND